MPLYEDRDGRILHAEPAGGTGGGATSHAVRHATDAEKLQFHDERVSAAETAVVAAQEHLAAVMDARTAHMDTLPKPEPEEPPPEPV